jgi:hypothetical protein
MECLEVEMSLQNESLVKACESIRISKVKRVTDH